jgi:hypothetical protein
MTYHLPTGVSSHSSSRQTPQQIRHASGTTKVMRHASRGEWPQRWTSESYTAGMMKYVMPPPALPQPPESALAVPTTFLSNQPVHQTWHGTNAPPRMPMKSRMM